PAVDERHGGAAGPLDAGVHAAVDGRRDARDAHRRHHHALARRCLSRHPRPRSRHPRRRAPARPHPRTRRRDGARVPPSSERGVMSATEQEVELHALRERLREREAEIDRLGQELAETNRGVLALYAELDDRAQALGQMSETKTRFLSDMGHELRAPLASMINLTRLLLARTDGPLTDEQEYQVTLIQSSAESLSEMVNDLLDIAKIE